MHFLKKIMTKEKTILLRFVQATLIFVLVANIAFIVAAGPREAKTAEAIGPPFGGMNLGVFWCNCSFNFKIIVGPPVGGIYMYNPWSTIVYPFGMVLRPGAWLLGLWGPPSVCSIYVGKGCAVIGAYPTMIMVGTSI